MPGRAIPRDLVEEHVDRLLASAQFRRSARLQRFVRLTVGWTLDGRAADVKERLLAVSVYGRDPGYDSRSNSIVRTEAHRLRAKLRDYYRGEGAREPLAIVYPEGSYVPVFEQRAPSRAVLEEAYQAAHFSVIDFANTWVAGLDRVAESRLQRILAQEPDHPDALADLAYLQLLRLYPPQDPPSVILERSMRLLERVLAREPNHVRSLCLWGEVRAALGQREESLAPVERAVALDPRSAFARTCLGLRYFGLGYYESALVEYERAIELEGAWEHALEGRAWVLAKLGRRAEAEEAARKISERIVLGPRPRWNAAVVYIEAGDLEGAAASAQAGLAQAAASSDTSHLEIARGLVAALRGDLEPARSVLQEYADSPPRTSDHLVRLCLVLGEDALALRKIRETPYVRNYRWLASEERARHLLGRPEWRELLLELHAEWHSELARVGPRLPAPPPELPGPEALAGPA